MKRLNGEPRFSLSATIKDLLSKNTVVYPLFIHFINYLFTYGHYKNLMENTIRHGKFNQPPHLRLGNKRKYFKIILLLLKYFICNKNNSIKSDIVFITRYRPIKTKQNGKIFETCYLFGNIIKEIHQNYPNTVMSLVTFGPEKKYEDPRVLNFNLFEFLNFWDFVNSLIKAFHLHLEYKFIKKRTNRYQEIFNRFFSVEYLFFIHLRDFATRRMIEKINPKVIVSNDDILQLKPNVNNKDFYFFVVQSATVNADLEKLRASLYQEFHLEERFFADYFLASGTKIKEIKEKISKDAKKVMVTGQPRYDKLYFTAKKYDRSKILKKFGLRIDKKIILWTTQTHSLPMDENIRNIEAVYDTIKNIDNVQLIVKLHPAEDQDAPLYKLDKSFKPVIVGGEEDTCSLIYACDLMITRHSTTAVEAVALNKPIAILNLSEKPDIADYVKEGVALGVYKVEDLKPTIKKLLRDDSILAENREAYIRRYLYKIDGMATKRVVNLIAEIDENEDISNWKNKSI